MENDKQFNNLQQKVKVKFIILASTLLFGGCAILQPATSPETSGVQPPVRIADYQGPYTVTGDDDYPAALKRPLPNLAANEQDNDHTQDDATIAQLEQDTAASDDDTVADQPPQNIWNRIRAGFALPDDVKYPRVKRELHWYVRHHAYLNRVVERAQPYMHYIVNQLDANNIPLEIALLPIVESAFQPFAYSHGRASGIWQFIPSTGRRYGLKQNWWYDGRRDVVASTQAAIKLLSNLHTEFHGDWLLALAAYNSGGGIVAHAIRKNIRRHRPTDFFSLDLPPETRYYVPKLLALKEIVSNPQKYNIHLARIDDVKYFDRIKVNSQIDLALAAKLADMDLDDLYELNPAFNRWATSPNGPSYLLIPTDNADEFKDNLAKYPPSKRVKWVRHRIRRGETISQVAMRYHTSIAVIRRVNHMRSNLLRAGHDLTIPVASRSLSSYKLSANQRKRRTQSKSRRGTKITHIVKNGDTLWDLAHRHGVGVRQLAKWNGMAPRDTLKPGQTIVIWSRHARHHGRFIPVNIKAPPRRSITRRIGYRVRRGDSLALISRKFNVTISQLLRWNRKIHRNRYLHPGQHLTLYVDITRTSS
jgi:membrane-bound lytic murein transglycosylase D